MYFRLLLEVNYNVDGNLKKTNFLKLKKIKIKQKEI